MGGYVLIESIKTAFSISSLGADLPSKIKLFVGYLYTLVGEKLSVDYKFWKDATLRLRVYGQSFELTLYGERDDLTLIREIFIDEEYQFNFLAKPRLILDLGSHIGFSAIYFKLKYPQARIFCFEPDPRNFEKLRKNTKQFDNVYIYQTAISGENGKTNFYIHPKKWSSSVYRRLYNQVPIQIKTRSIDSILEEFLIKEVDLIKFDIEGSELRVFKNFKSYKKVKNLIGELHVDLINGTKEEFLDILRVSGFETNLLKHSPKRYTVKASRVPHQK